MCWADTCHIRFTQYSFMLQLIDICFLPFICMCHISLIQTCLRVVIRPGFVSTSHTFMKSGASHAAGIKLCLIILSYVAIGYDSFCAICN